MFVSELGDIPEGWKVSTIGDEVETVGGGTPSTTEPSYWENGDIPWYSPTDLTKAKTLFSIDSEKKITKLGLQKSSARLFPKYSLLLTSRATIGEVTINTKEACTNQGFITIISNTKFSVYFLYGWLLTKIGVIKQLASGSTFPEISKTNFRGLDFLIPASNILEKYEHLIKPIYTKIETNIFQIQTLTKTRDSLLPKLMSGQLRVKE
jgi:type I restriction enzyme S subunit